MNIADILDLYEYNRWASERTLEAAYQLGKEEYSRTSPGSFNSLRAILEHILATEVVWLSRWEGHSLGEAPDYAGCVDVVSLMRIWGSYWTRQSRFLNALSDEDLSTPVAIRTRSGIETVQPLGETLVHVVNHATYHRGQAASLIRALGGTPQSTDYFTYCLMRGLKTAAEQQTT
jgi:uncharacterized damage-inducible protein DinB